MLANLNIQAPKKGPANAASPTADGDKRNKYKKGKAMII
jgi:hypothetical protein